MSTKAYHGLQMPAERDGATSVFEMVVYPDLAAKLLESFKWERQRKPKQQTISMYGKLMERGEYKANTLIRLAWHYRENELHLLDGQHRLSGQVMANVPVKYIVSVEAVRNEQEAAEIYATIDRNALRTPFDQFHALAVDLEHGWSQTMTNSAVSAIKFLANDFLPSYPKGMTTQNQLDLIEKYADTASRWFDFVSEHTGVVLSTRSACRRDVMSVGIVTFHFSAKIYGSAKIEDFWAGALSGEMLKKGDPRLAAHAHLVSTALTGGGLQQTTKDVMSSNVSSRKLCNFFNAWLRNETRTFTRVKDGNAPALILGSPWDGKSIHVEKTLWNNM